MDSEDEGEAATGNVQGGKAPKEAGICIDSSRIQTSSVASDVQEELSGLGVSVYNQLEFEAGVLQQIDSEVQRRNAEQDRKFLLKEYENIKGEINSLHQTLTTISKTIAGLLQLPLRSVGHRLRELRAAQDQKKKQLVSLEAREQTVLRRLTGKCSPETGEVCDSSSTSQFGDVPFGIPAPSGGRGGASAEGVGGATLEEEQQLIRTGQMTPFGTSLSGVVNSLSSNVSVESSLEASGSPGDFGDSTGKSFRQARIPKKPGATSDLSDLADDTLPSQSQSGSLEPSLEDSFGPDDWVPSLADLLDSASASSAESEYFTDDELGGPKKKKKKRLRELSSDGLSDSGDERTRSRKRRRKGKGKKVAASQRRYNDDGDEELYLQRLCEFEETKPECVAADVKFDGGLTIPGSVWHRLYRYQQTGVKWLWELHTQQAGGVVGDEMGLGKTIQMIAFLTGLKISNLRSHVTRKLGLGPVLIVCPATVMHQWVSEFHIWWPPFRVAVLHGTGSHGGSKKQLVTDIVESDGVLITTYSGIRLDQDILLSHKWDYVVLDEGHKIRNPDAEITLACKQVTTPHRLILSGSPMQNNLRELWSLFDFVFPGKLGTLPVFLEQFSVPITLGGYANATEVQVQTAYKCACILRDTINPYMLRRLKADVKLQLPDKNEQVLFCRLTEYQCELYKDYIQSSAVEAMLDRGKQVFAGLMALRKLCNHPDLVTADYCEYRTNEKEEREGKDGGLSVIAAPKKKRTRKNGQVAAASGSNQVLPPDPEDEEGYGHWRRSGKMVVVDSLLKLWRAQGHRVLLFSQSKAMLDILERFLRGKGYTYQRMDGTTAISTRQPLVNNFNEDSSIFAFLLTTRVGGLGINLTGADRVLIYDPDWNPSTDTQARERAWRIGQTKPVTIYRLLTSGTIEEKIYHRQIFKQFLTNRVLKDPRQRRFFKSNNLHELFTLSSSAVEGSTETSALFAGTGSEIVPGRPCRARKSGSHDQEGRVRKKRKPSDSRGKGKSKRRKTAKSDSLPVSGHIAADLEASSGQAHGKAGHTHIEAVHTHSEADHTHIEVHTHSEADHTHIEAVHTQAVHTHSEEDHTHNDADHTHNDADHTHNEACHAHHEAGHTHNEEHLTHSEADHTNNDRTSGTQSDGMDLESNGESKINLPSPKGKTELRELKREKKKKKKKKKSKIPAVVDGEEIMGLAYSSVFNPGEEDEEENSQQDDFILQKLFKKSGVHSALQHDTIMNSDNPDYVLVEAEATKVAKSASKALKVSRRQCLQMGAARGRPTWTGNSGMAGGPLPSRFGAGMAVKAKQLPAKPFSGITSPAEQSSGSLNKSSSILLAKMRQRNAHTMSDGQEAGVGGAIGIHDDSHGELVREIRDFIATQGKVNGQVTTAELLAKFSKKLPNSDGALFRSMLYEICDFSRHLGDGLWSLKPEFR